MPYLLYNVSCTFVVQKWVIITWEQDQCDRQFLFDWAVYNTAVSDWNGNIRSHIIFVVLFLNSCSNVLMNFLFSLFHEIMKLHVKIVEYFICYVLAVFSTEHTLCAASSFTSYSMAWIWPKCSGKPLFYCTLVHHMTKQMIQPVLSDFVMYMIFLSSSISIQASVLIIWRDTWIAVLQLICNFQSSHAVLVYYSVTVCMAWIFVLICSHIDM